MFDQNMKLSSEHGFYNEKKEEKEMLKSAFGAFVKMIKIETLYWKMMKNEEVNFLKVKTLLNSM